MRVYQGWSATRSFAWWTKAQGVLLERRTAGSEVTHERPIQLDEPADWVRLRNLERQQVDLRGSGHCLRCALQPVDDVAALRGGVDQIRVHCDLLRRDEP